MKRLTAEEALHRSVCSYIDWNYKGVIYNSDMSGVRLSMRQAILTKNLRSSRAFPDIVVYEPKGVYHGLFIELKAVGKSPFKKDGVSLLQNKHVIEQAQMIEKLKAKGYHAQFCTGFDEAKKCVDWYLNL